MKHIKINNHLEDHIRNTLRNICEDDNCPDYYELYSSQIRGDVTNVLLFREDDFTRIIKYIMERHSHFLTLGQASPCSLVVTMLNEQGINLSRGVLSFPEDMYLNKLASEA